jgi:hypothetical protein
VGAQGLIQLMRNRAAHAGSRHGSSRGLGSYLKCWPTCSTAITAHAGRTPAKTRRQTWRDPPTRPRTSSKCWDTPSLPQVRDV